MGVSCFAVGGGWEGGAALMPAPAVDAVGGGGGGGRGGAALMPAPPMGGATPMGGFSPAQATNVESLQVM